MKTLKHGVADYDQMMARTRGENKTDRGKPIVWFTSIESFARMPSKRNQEILRLIAREKPDSLIELAELGERNKSNFSRTRKAMSRYGFMALKKRHSSTLIPRVRYDQMRLDISLASTRSPLQGWIGT